MIAFRIVRGSSRYNSKHILFLVAQALREPRVYHARNFEKVVLETLTYRPPRIRKDAIALMIPLFLDYA